MKKNFKWLLALVAMVASINLMWAGEVVFYTNTCPEDTKAKVYDQEKTTTVDNIDWIGTVNRNAANDWRIGGKGKTALDRYLYTGTAISENITKVVLTHGQKSAGTVGKVKLDVFSTKALASAGGTGDISSISLDYVDNGTMTFTRPTGHNWTSRFYRFSYSVNPNNSSNKAVILKKIEFYYDNTPAEPVAPSFTVQPEDATYEQNETATPLSIEVTGNPNPELQWYSNTTKSTSGATAIANATNASYTPSTTTVGTKYYYCVATNSKGSVTSEIATVEVAAAITGDVLTRESTGISSGSGYGSWSDKTGSQGVARYAGNTAGNNGIQMRNSDNSGIVSTTSAGLIRTIKISWNNSTAANRSVNVYGSNTAYTEASNLYGDNVGTELGTIGRNDSKLTITGDYEYVGIKAVGGALYLNDITFVWEAAKEITKVEVTKSPTKTTYNAKEFFDPAGMEVTLTYDDGSTKVIAYSSTDTKWSFVPDLTTPLTNTDDAIAVTYAEKDAEDFVEIIVNPLTSTINATDTKVEVNDMIEDWSKIYSITTADGEEYDGNFVLTSDNPDVFAIEEGVGMAYATGTANVTISAPKYHYQSAPQGTKYYTGDSKIVKITVEESLPEYEVVWSAQTGTITGGQNKVKEGSSVETLPIFDEKTVCDGNSFMGWTNEEIPTPTNTPPSVLFKTAADAPKVQSDDAKDNKVTYYAVYAKNKVQDYKKVTSIATGDKVIIALEDNNGKPVTGVTGAITDGKDATVSSNETDWLVFTIEDGNKFKNGDNYIVAASKSFKFGTTGTALSVNDDSYLVYNNGTDDYSLKYNTDGYYRFYTNTGENYIPFYVYSAKKEVLSGYSTTCTAPVTINDPTILPEEREIAAASQEVTITQTQTGVGEISIYYTTDGTEPTTESTKYTGGFMIGEGTTVVKAIAADNAGNQSGVVTATFKLDKGYVSTIAEFLAKEEDWTGEMRFTTENFAVITARSADGKTIYMQDETGAICVYYSGVFVKAAAINSKVVGTVSGKRANNVGVPELIPGSGQFPAASIVDGGTRPTPIEIEAVNEAAWIANPCKLVTLKNVYYSTSSNGHYTFTNEGGTESNDIYDSFGILSGKTMPETTAKCNVTGIMIRYSATYELAPALIEEITTDQTAALPSLKLNGEAETSPSTDEQNPKKVDYLSPVVITPAVKTSLVINGEALTESSKTFNISAATTIAITAKRDFYADNSVTYYYAPAQTPYNITINENVHGSAVAKVNGVPVEKTLSTYTVTLVVTPNAHWNLNQSNWSIKDASEGNVPYTEVSTNNFNFTMPESDVTVTLSFTQDPKYSVTFDKNGDAEGDDPTIDDQYVGAEVILPNNPYTWENHSFQGWIVTDAATGKTIVPQSEGKFTMPTYNVKVTAQWKEIQSCKISFVVAGEEQSYVNQPQEEKYTITETAVAPEGFEFKGWSLTNVEDETQNPATLVTEYTPTTDETAVSLYAVFSYTKQTATYGKYVKVTSAPNDWSGDYLIVNETNSKVMKGSLTSIDVALNFETATFEDGVATLENADNYIFTIAKGTTNYTVKSKAGYYMTYNTTSDNNGLGNGSTNVSQAVEYPISMDDKNNVEIQCPGKSTVRLHYFAGTSPNYTDARFRFYKNDGQSRIQLYTKDNGVVTYTSYPFPKVTITFDANGGDKACDNEVINKGAELTICDDIPAQRGKSFKYWEDASHNTYNPGETYTFNEDATLTAQWDNLPVRHITYNINGGTGTTPVDANDYYKDDQVTLASGEGIEKDGFAFNGWKVTYNGTEEVTVTAGKFSMPDADVTATAQWRDERVSYWHLVTNTSMLKAGDQVIVAAAGDYLHAMGVENNNLRGVVTIEKEKDTEHFDDEKIKYTTSPVVFTLEKGTVDGTFAFYDGENYLATSSSSNKISHSATKTDEASWEITIDANGKTQVVAQGTNTYKHLKYNTDGSPRFSGYSSATSCKPVALYKYIEGEKAVREVTSGAYTTFCIPQGVEAGNFYGATFWNIADKAYMEDGVRLYSITIEQEEGNLGAGVPYIMLADAETTEFVYYATGTEETAGTKNGLVGVFATTMFGSVESDEEAIERGIYIISDGTLYLCGNNCGVYGNRAYILRDQIYSTAPTGAPRRTIGRPNDTPTTLNGLFGNKTIKAQKALINGNIYIIRDNKMYNAQGIKIQ